MEYFLELIDIEKSYDKNKVLSNMDFKVKEGLVTVVMGQNGVGKTTLINIILGLTKYDEGSIIIKKSPVYSNLTLDQKKMICFIPDTPFFLEYLTGFENLEYISKIYGKNLSSLKIKNVMIEFDLESENTTLVKNYSRGMKTKLNLCFIEIIDAPCVILDEPTIGLDITSIEYLRNRISDFKKQGKTILITSHDMEFVRSVADEIYLLNNKKIIPLFDVNQKENIRDINILTDSLLMNLSK